MKVICPHCATYVIPGCDKCTNGFVEATTLQFVLNENQVSKFLAWRKEQEQLTRRGECETFSFTPGQGFCTVVVTNSITKQSIDLTDYE